MEKYVGISKIISAIAIPIVIAIAGWAIQSSISQDTIKKEYIQIAVSILSDENKAKNAEMRDWATSIIEKYSPVPFSQKLKESLYVPKISIPEIGLSKKGANLVSRFEKEVFNKDKSIKSQIDAKNILSIAADGDDAIRELNMCIDAYEAVRVAVNPSPSK